MLPVGLILRTSKRHAIPGIIRQKTKKMSSSGPAESFVRVLFAGIVCVETTSSPPAAGGSPIPSQIGQLELRVLLAAPGGGLGKGLCTEEAVFFFVTVRENLCDFCGDFRAPEQRHVKNK